MQIFELTLVLLVVAVALTALARRLHVPYPSLLALGGLGIALLPNAPPYQVNPELTLALFLGPVVAGLAGTVLPALPAVSRKPTITATAKP